MAVGLGEMRFEMAAQDCGLVRVEKGVDDSERLAQRRRSEGGGGDTIRPAGVSLFAPLLHAHTPTRRSGTCKRQLKKSTEPEC
jgi:hypothetical protein